MTADGVLLTVWIGFMILGVSAASTVLFWGIRSGQFGDQEHARSLPLLGEIPGEKREDVEGSEKRSVSRDDGTNGKTK